MESIVKDWIKNFLTLGENFYFQTQLDEGMSFKPVKNSDGLYDSYKSLMLATNQNECYRNALLASLTTDLDYYQGYYVTENVGIPLEHAWNVKDGQVLDFTAKKFNIPIVEYWGVEIPKTVLEEYLNTEQYLTAFEFYLRKIYKKD